MKKTINILAAGLAVASIASCDLDLSPKGSLSYDPENIITNETDLDGFEAGVMSSLRGLDAGVYDITSDVMVDYFNAIADFGNNYGPVHRLDASFTASDYDTEDNWSGPYLAINNFNILIEGARNVDASLAAGAAVARGEAFFARAYAYLHLVRHFAKPYGATSSTDLGVPLVLVYDQNARPARNTVAEVYDQIKQDLDSAAVLLSGVEGSARAEKPSIDAVNALYARYYLDTQNYSKAAEYAQKVIDTGNYTLANTAELMEAEYVDDSGTEPILQYYCDSQEGGYGSHSAYLNSGTSTDYGQYFSPYFIPCAKLVNSYGSSDLRLAQWFDNTTYVFTSSRYFKGDFYTFVKFYGNQTLYPSATVPTSYQSKKPLMIGEMYLIAAEAYLEAGNASAAKTALNTLQNARGATQTDATEANVKTEWYREVVGEGLYFSCLKRWGDGFSGRAGQSGAVSDGVLAEGSYYEERNFTADDYHWQWPIPTYEMQTNLNLVQNDGYSSSAE